MISRIPGSSEGFLGELSKFEENYWIFWGFYVESLKFLEIFLWFLDGFLDFLKNFMRILKIIGILWGFFGDFFKQLLYKLSYFYEDSQSSILRNFLMNFFWMGQQGRMCSSWLQVLQPIATRWLRPRRHPATGVPHLRRGHHQDQHGQLLVDPAQPEESQRLSRYHDVLRDSRFQRLHLHSSAVLHRKRNRIGFHQVILKTLTDSISLINSKI